MHCLLDTHALLWALTDPSSLGRQAKQLMKSRSTVLHVSAASAWELATKIGSDGYRRLTSSSRA